MTDKIRLVVINGELESLPSELAETFGWDNRKHLLDVYYEGRNADWLDDDDDDFQRNYAGLMAVARYAMNETIEAARTNIAHAADWEQKE